MEDLERQENQNGMAGWIRWLYLIVGCVIVCILVWMFMALSNRQVELSQQQEATYQTVPTDTLPTPVPTNQVQ